MIKLTIVQKIFFGFILLVSLSASFLLISFPSLTQINTLSSMIVPLSRKMAMLDAYTERVKRLEKKAKNRATTLLPR
jgi:hypothetical protein